MTIYNQFTKTIFFLFSFIVLSTEPVNGCQEVFRGNKKSVERKVWVQYLENKNLPVQGDQQKNRRKQQQSPLTNESIRSLEKRIGYSFKKRKGKKQNLRKQVMLQSSKLNKERLEFLGDTVFNLSVLDVLMDKYPNATRKELNTVWTRLISNVVMSDLAVFIHLHQQYNVSLIRSKKKLADLLEMIVGAVYLDGGYREAKKLVRRLIEIDIKKNFESRGYQELLDSHSSTGSNGALKSLGRLVFILHMTDILMRKYTRAKPNFINHKRTLIKLWIMQTVVHNFDLEPFTIGKKELSHQVASTSVESILGAMYAEGNYIGAKELMFLLFGDVVKIEPVRVIINTNRSYEDILDEFIYNNSQRSLSYKSEEMSGDLKRKFSVKIYLGNRVLGVGRGMNKHEATQNAAFSALRTLGSIPLSQL